MAIYRTETASFYRKGQGEVQFGFIAPKWKKGTTQINDDEVEVHYVDRKGAILIEAAKAFENSEKSDWTNKVRFSLGFVDFGQILTGLRGPSRQVKLTHTHPVSKAVSTLQIQQGQRAGTWKLDLNGVSVSNGEKVWVGLYLSDADLASIVQLVEFATPRVMGWHQA